MSSVMSMQRVASDRTAEFYSPTGASDARTFTAAPRRARTAGARVALLSNQKRNADKLLTEVERLLQDEHGIALAFHEEKVAMSLPAPTDQLYSIAQRADALIVAVGDCGSCSATSVMDAIAAERIGIPAVPIVTDQFRVGAETVARIQGANDFPVAYVAHPIATITDAEINERARVAVDAVIGILEGAAPASQS